MIAEILDAGEAAAFLHLSERYMRKLRANKCGPKYARIGDRGDVRYKRADLLKWYDSMEVVSNRRWPKNVEE